MNKNFTIYAIIIIVLISGIAWQKVLFVKSNNQSRTGFSGGSGWSSTMGNGSWAGGSGGHK